jgi:hypothetical protein
MLRIGQTIWSGGPSSRVSISRSEVSVRTTYRPVSAGTYTDEGMGPLMAVAYPNAFTLIDLRLLRPLVFGQRHKALDAELVRTIHGFDALLVLTGSTASANL